MEAEKSSKPKPLSAIDKNSFAYLTIKDRLPVTITKGIDFLSRNRNDLIKRFGGADSDVAEDLKSAIERLSQLRYELVTDKPMRPLLDSFVDAIYWNQSLKKLTNEIGEENCSWFKAPWLFTECYMYRRVFEAMQLCQTDLKHYDPFEQAKIESHDLCLKNIFGLIISLCPLNYEEEEKQSSDVLSSRFKMIVQAQLWSNKNDLSLSSGEDVSSKVKNLIGLIDSLKSHLLCDHLESLWNYVDECKSTSERIDIILDNCAIELASDLVLADFLLRNNLTKRIVLHGKLIPWFISDVMENDFQRLMRILEASNSLIVYNFLRRITGYLKENKLITKFDNPFWTSPYAFDRMKTEAAELFDDLKQNSSLVIFKGDLNYRKLIGDLDWPFDTPISQAVGSFQLTLCAIRTLKSDLVANLDLNNENSRRIKEEFISKNDKKWMITGDYGIIQFLRV